MIMNMNLVSFLGIPQQQMLYAKIEYGKFYKRPVFPKQSLLRSLNTSQASARTLVRHIFMNENERIMENGKYSNRAKIQKVTENSKNALNRRYFIKRRRKPASDKFLQAFGPLMFPEKQKVKEPEFSKPKMFSPFMNAFGLALATQNLTRKSRFSSRKRNVPRHLRKAIAVCRFILKKAKRNKFPYLLQVHCPVPEKINSICISRLLEMHSPAHQVFLFLRSVIKFVFSLNVVWGTDKNEKAFLKNLEKFLLCRRFDVITVKDLLLGISVPNISWLAGPHAAKSFCKFLKWMLVDFVFLILRRFFYITEHSGHRYRLFYYRKDIWEQLMLKASKLMVNRGIWSPVDSSIPAQFWVKFFPKTSSLRPLMMRHKYESDRDLLPSRDILLILRHISKRFPQVRGCSSSGKDDISMRWRGFWKACRKNSGNVTNVVRLHFVKVDVYQCFDTIPVDLLLKIIREILDRSSHVVVGGLFSFKRNYTTVADCADEICSTLEQYLKDVHISVAGKKFLKVKGIPQGWSLSSLLCDIFYADLESKHLKEFWSNHKKCSNEDSIRMLIRFVDDFMFVSTSENEAVAFIKKIKSGFPEYGFNINWRKTCANFSVHDLGLDEKKEMTIMSPEAPFSWFGMLFPTLFSYSWSLNRFSSNFQASSNFGGVSIDLSRYSSASSIRDSTSIMTSLPEHHVHKSLSRFLRLRVAAIYFDLNVNSLTRVLRNLYELAVLAACKWLVHEMCKPLLDRSKNTHATLLLIRRLAITVLITIRKKLPGQRFPNVDVVIWIFYKAFYKKLFRYQQPYKKLCSIISFRLRKLLGKLQRRYNWVMKYMRFSTACLPLDLRRSSLCIK